MFARPLVRATSPLTKNLRLRPRFVRPNSSSSAALDSFVTPSKIINAQGNMGINITQRAAKRLAEISKDTNEALRVCVESGGCHGFQYNLKLITKDEIKLNASSSETQHSETANAAKSDQNFEDDDDADFESKQDTIFELPDNGGQVVLDEKSLKILNNTTLTYTTELIGSTFKLAGGNMKNSCGCGSSFDVEL
ncbi:LAME_0E05710g1_1 [Lachancea meyersii CBS 8951]|uniref:LAME_0E05710g1_1 n=1 Tax=Lachancea meyersii CBS 8951 TaxID=1266667 RepID=A0A1G4JHG4_9SACH|nr:LAME_0E05710g1_1 [Lachancea meyersii CBS 8951]